MSEPVICGHGRQMAICGECFPMAPTPPKGCSPPSPEPPRCLDWMLCAAKDWTRLTCMLHSGHVGAHSGGMWSWLDGRCWPLYSAPEPAPAPAEREEPGGECPVHGEPRPCCVQIGYQRGLEEMRERAARVADPQDPLPATAEELDRMDPGDYGYRSASAHIAAAIRALPLQPDVPSSHPCSICGLEMKLVAPDTYECRRRDDHYFKDEPQPDAPAPEKEKWPSVLEARRCGCENCLTRLREWGLDPASSPSPAQEGEDYTTLIRPDCEQVSQERSALIACLAEWEKSRPSRCVGEWVGGSGGHRNHTQDCAEDPVWFDPGDPYAYCDKHAPKQDIDREYIWRHPRVVPRG